MEKNEYIAPEVYVPVVVESPENILEEYRLRYIKASNRQLWAQIFKHESFDHRGARNNPTQLVMVLMHPSSGREYNLIELSYNEEKQWPVNLTVKKNAYYASHDGVSYPDISAVEGFDKLSLDSPSKLRRKLNEVLGAKAGDVQKGLMNLMKD